MDIFFQLWKVLVESSIFYAATLTLLITEQFYTVILCEGARGNNWNILHHFFTTFQNTFTYKIYFYGHAENTFIIISQWGSEFQNA